MSKSALLQFINCKILRDHKIITEDIWVRDGKIMNPEKIFFDEKVESTQKINCFGNIIAPGLIDIQINGGFGCDFSHDIDSIEDGLNLVSKNLLSHGVTAYCPTVVTSPSEVYHKVLNRIKKRAGGQHGATILGIHIEGPFISIEKKGAHPPDYIRKFDKGFNSVEEVYGSLENVKIVTIAPELENSVEVIKKFREKDIVVSLGHSIADLQIGEKAVNNGATLITHLFNAMLPFHHRDPGLVGLLASSNIPKNTTIYFGIISDGVHTHPAALRIAYRVHPNGLILVTDAISALGLQEGKHNLGQFEIEVRNGCAYIAGTDTLCGSIGLMLDNVKLFHKATGCRLEYALEAASLHPAKLLGINHCKGTLNYGADADFIMLNDKLDLISTWIAGECVYSK